MKFTLDTGSLGRVERRGTDSVHVVYRKGDVVELTADQAASAALRDRITPFDPRAQQEKVAEAVR